LRFSGAMHPNRVQRRKAKQGFRPLRGRVTFFLGQKESHGGFKPEVQHTNQ